MLTHSFCHVSGISPKVERQLWSDGVLGWDELLAAQTLPLSPRKRERLCDGVGESRQHLAAGNARYFADTLPAREQWRLFSHFRGSVAYIDIETTGLSSQHNMVTTIALYDGRRICHYVQGENLDQFGRDIADYSLIVTYNGKCFDLPFMSQNMGLKFPQAHIDLRYVLKSLGYSGGLKGCEKQLGLHRGDLEDVDGFFAVLLWQDYCASGNRKTLETLLAYNIQDVVNLEVLLVKAYNLKLAQTPFAQSHQLGMPASPKLPFQADPKIIARVRKQSGWHTW